MSRVIDPGLKDLSATLHRMGELAHHAVSAALLECLEGGEAYKEVREMADALVAMDDQVQDKAVELIARYQPVATDLRTIKSYMKIAYDLARFGRYALDISYINERIGGLKHCEEWITSHVKGMGEKALDMVKLSIESLGSHDPPLAERISTEEKEVDKMYLEFLDALIKNGTTPKCTTSSVLIVRYLERIADHATYICEATIYIATGQKQVLR
jgi:phosphate transport system protein